jgi:hypothetical protein
LAAVTTFCHFAYSVSMCLSSRRTARQLGGAGVVDLLDHRLGLDALDDLVRPLPDDVGRRARRGRDVPPGCGVKTGIALLGDAMQPRRSVVPPGANGTTMRICLLGQAPCAKTSCAPMDAVTAPAIAARRRLIKLMAILLKFGRLYPRLEGRQT